jgi:LmbE family N-acetylglucosaminyl deacetylase
VTDLLPALPEEWDRGLAVVAHPDDIEYGTAACVARWTAQGKTVTYLLATRGEAGIDGLHPDQCGPLREGEERAGAREVGVDVVEFLDHPDGVISDALRLRREIAREIRIRRPEVVVSTAYSDRMAGNLPNQADHRIVGLAALDAARDAGNRWIFPEQIEQEGLEPWGGVKYVCFNGAPNSTHGVDVTGEPLRRGIASLAAHAEYLKGLGPDAPSAEKLLNWFATMCGPRLGVEAAMLFDVYPLTFEAPPEF